MAVTQLNLYSQVLADHRTAGVSDALTGDIFYSSNTTGDIARLVGNTSTTVKVLTSTGTGIAAQAPAWTTPSAAINTYSQASALGPLATSGVTTVQLALDEIDNTMYYSDEVTGLYMPSWKTPTTSSLAWDDGTLTLTHAPIAPATTFSVWFKGKRFLKSGSQTATITDTEGIWYFFYNSSGTLSCNQTLWEIDNPTVVPVAVIYWDATNNTAIMVGEERHGTAMDCATHNYLHGTFGTRYETGLTFGDYTLSTPGTIVGSLTDGEIHDEDIAIDITHAAVPGTNQFEQVLRTTNKAKIPIFYRSGASGVWRKTAASASYDLVTGGANRHYYNQYTGGSWVNTEITASQFSAVWLFATNNISEPIIGILGQRADTTLTNAINNNTYESLSFGTIPFTEFKVIYRLIFKSVGGVGAFPAQTSLENVTDYRSVSNAPSGTYVATAHAVLTGLDYASAGHTGFVELQSSTPGTQQTGHINVSGNGIFATSLAVGTSTISANYQVNVAKTAGTTGTPIGSLYFVTNRTTADAAVTSIGVVGECVASHTSGTIGTMYALFVTASGTGNGGTTTGIVGVYAVAGTSAGHTTTSIKCIEAYDSCTGGTVTTWYGLYINTPSATPATKYSIYTGTAQSYFGGNVGIGTTAPGNRLTILTDGSGTGTDPSDQVRIEGDAVANPMYLKMGVNDAGLYGYIQSTQTGIGHQYLALMPLGGSVGIGTTAPTSRLTVSLNAASLQAVVTGGVAHFGNVDSTATRVLIDSYGAANSLDFRRAAGTAATPSAVGLDAALGAVRVWARGSTAYSSAARAVFQMSASEAWTDAAQGTYFTWQTTATGGTTTSEKMRLSAAGYLGIGQTAPDWQAEIMGAGQDTAAIDDAGVKTGALCIRSSSNNSGSGGAIIFAGNNVAGDYYGAIKGLLHDGTANTRGHLAFSTRNANADTALTERMRITYDGLVGIGTLAPAYIFSVGATFGSQIGIQYATEEITVAAAATSVSVANLIPVSCILLAIAVRVTTVIPGPATSFDVTSDTDGHQCALSVAVAAGTTNAGTYHWSLGLSTWSSAAQKVRITPNAVPGAGTGKVRVTVYYVATTPPTS